MHQMILFWFSMYSGYFDLLRRKNYVFQDCLEWCDVLLTFAAEIYLSFLSDKKSMPGVQWTVLSAPENHHLQDYTNMPHQQKQQ